MTVTKIDPMARALAAQGLRPTDARVAHLVAPAAPRPCLPEDLADGAVHIGNAAPMPGAIGLDLARLVEGRLLIQGASGAGKSWTLRRLLELTAGTVQQIVIDPEDEFAGLAERFGHLHLDGAGLDAHALGVAAARAREHRLSLVVGLGQVDRGRQMIAVTAILKALVAGPREHWHPVLVAVDEAHLFAPHGDQSSAPPAVRQASVAAMTDMMARGRKRGLIGVIATQRLARLAKSVVAEALNVMVGRNTLDLDIRRAAETIGWDARRAFDRLPALEPGEFVASGPAFSVSPAVLKVGPVTTVHVGAAPALEAPAAVSAEDAAALLDLEGLTAGSDSDAEVRGDDRLPATVRGARALLREPEFAAAARIWAELVPLTPDGALVAAIGAGLGLGADDAAAALALLDRYGVLEFAPGSGPGQAVVRADPGMIAAMTPPARGGGGR